MDFPREELLEKYIHLYEQQVAPYEPDFEMQEGLFNVSLRNV